MIFMHDELFRLAQERHERGLLAKSEDRYSMDRKELEKWSEAYGEICTDEDEDAHTIAKIFAECAMYVSFANFLKYLLEAFGRFLKDNGGDDYVFVYAKEDKSNFWVAQLLVFFGRDIEGYVPPSYITNDMPAFRRSIKTQNKTYRDFTFVICDDASYTGIQAADLVEPITLKHMKLAFVFAACTKIARETIEDRLGIEFKSKNSIYSSLSYKFYYGFPLMTIPDILEEKEAEAKTAPKKALYSEYLRFVENSGIDDKMTKYFLDFLKSNNSESENGENNNNVMSHYQYNIYLNVPVYFEHKMPDAISSYPSMFVGYVTKSCKRQLEKNFKIVRNCVFDNSNNKYMTTGSTLRDDCATPFYKASYKKSNATRKSILTD